LNSIINKKIKEEVKNLNYLNEEKPYLELLIKQEPFSYQNHRSEKALQKRKS
jgi:hypothetical protein